MDFCLDDLDEEEEAQHQEIKGLEPDEVHVHCATMALQVLAEWKHAQQGTLDFARVQIGDAHREKKSLKELHELLIPECKELVVNLKEAEDMTGIILREYAELYVDAAKGVDLRQSGDTKKYTSQLATEMKRIRGLLDGVGGKDLAKRWEGVAKELPESMKRVVESDFCEMQKNDLYVGQMVMVDDPKQRYGKNDDKLAHITAKTEDEVRFTYLNPILGRDVLKTEDIVLGPISSWGGVDVNFQDYVKYVGVLGGLAYEPPKYKGEQQGGAKATKMMRTDIARTEDEATALAQRLSFFNLTHATRKSDADAILKDPVQALAKYEKTFAKYKRKDGSILIAEEHLPGFAREVYEATQRLSFFNLTHATRKSESVAPDAPDADDVLEDPVQALAASGEFSQCPLLYARFANALTEKLQEYEDSLSKVPQANSPSGMTAVVGPTQSGKSTLVNALQKDALVLPCDLVKKCGEWIKKGLSSESLAKLPPDLVKQCGLEAGKPLPTEDMKAFDCLYPGKYVSRANDSAKTGFGASTTFHAESNETRAKGNPYIVDTPGICDGAGPDIELIVDYHVARILGSKAVNSLILTARFGGYTAETKSTDMFDYLANMLGIMARRVAAQWRGDVNKIKSEFLARVRIASIGNMTDGEFGVPGRWQEFMDALATDLKGVVPCLDVSWKDLDRIVVKLPPPITLRSEELVKAGKAPKETLIAIVQNYRPIMDFVKQSASLSRLAPLQTGVQLFLRQKVKDYILGMWQKGPGAEPDARDAPGPMVVYKSMLNVLTAHVDDDGNPGAVDENSDTLKPFVEALCSIMSIVMRTAAQESGAQERFIPRFSKILGDVKNGGPAIAYDPAMIKVEQQAVDATINALLTLTVGLLHQVGFIITSTVEEESGKEVLPGYIEPLVHAMNVKGVNVMTTLVGLSVPELNAERGPETFKSQIEKIRNSGKLTDMPFEKLGMLKLVHSISFASVAGLSMAFMAEGVFVWGATVATTMWWNPVGWAVAILTLAGLGVATYKSFAKDKVDKKLTNCLSHKLIPIYACFQLLGILVGELKRFRNGLSAHQANWDKGLVGVVVTDGEATSNEEKSAADDQSATTESLIGLTAAPSAEGEAKKEPASTLTAAVPPAAPVPAKEK